MTTQSIGTFLLVICSPSSKIDHSARLSVPHLFNGSHISTPLYGEYLGVTMESMRSYSYDDKSVKPRGKGY
jgi:hypothetical protein